MVAAGFGAANVALASQLGRPVSQQTVSTEPSGPTDVAVDLTTDRLEAPPALASAGPEVGPDHVFDLLITNGRVIDPASGFDGALEVGINDGVITAIQPPGGTARALLDVGGQVVAPGFIDLLSADPNRFGEWFKVADGVTTNLAMHGVNNYANAFFDNNEAKMPIHFGGAFHQHFMRGQDAGLRPDQDMSAEELSSFVTLARQNLDNGFAGVCFSPEYSPATSQAEIDALAAVLAERGHAAFFHVRYSDPEDPGTSFEAIEEVLGVARRHGIGVHIEHIASTGGTFVMAETLDMLESARGEGIDVTACVYPYDYWATTLASFRFAGDWQARYRIGVDSLQVAGTTQRLNASTFDQGVADNLLVAALGSIPDDEVRLALSKPWIMIGSDGILTESLNNHPRASGTFARTLGHYSRDLGALSLVDALAKMTILPATRMEAMLPAMAAKGRMQRGADADITIFDPATIADRATVAEPNLPSVGVNHVFVAGQQVVRDGEVQRDVLAGRALKSTPSG